MKTKSAPNFHQPSAAQILHKILLQSNDGVVRNLWRPFLSALKFDNCYKLWNKFSPTSRAISRNTSTLYGNSTGTVLLNLPGSLCWLHAPAAVRGLHCCQHQLQASEVCCLMRECVHVRERGEIPSWTNSSNRTTCLGTVALVGSSRLVPMPFSSSICRLHY